VLLWIAALRFVLAQRAPVAAADDALAVDRTERSAGAAPPTPATALLGTQARPAE
jgi:hypothetical protein